MTWFSPVLLDISYSIFQVTQSLCWILSVKEIRTWLFFPFRSDAVSKTTCSLLPAQLAYQVLGSLGNLLGEVHLLNAFQDEGVRHHLVTPWKWRTVVGKKGKHENGIPPDLRSKCSWSPFVVTLITHVLEVLRLHLCWPAGEELKHQDTQRPEVHAEVMAFVEDDLRGHVFRGPTECPGLLATSDLFGKTKVDLETPTPLATASKAEPVLMWHTRPYGFRLWTPARRGSSPAWCSLQHPAWDSQASGLCRGRLYGAGNQKPRWHSPHRIWPWVLQNFPWNKDLFNHFTQWHHWCSDGSFSYLSLSRLHTSPPRQASSSM